MEEIKSFDSKDFKSLMLDFLWFYPSIEGITKDKVLRNKYPLLESKVYSLLNKRDLKSKKIKISQYDISQTKVNKFVFTKKDTVLLDLLRHIRNSIAHGNLKVHPDDNNIIIVKDYNDKSKRGLTCYGLITFNKLVELLKVKDL